MTNRHGGRLSKAERELVLIGDDDGGIIERPKPLPELTPEEKDEWTAICAAVPATYFPPATWPIVRSYCRHVVLERHLARMIRREASKKAFDLKRYQALTRELRAQTSAIVACLRSLRLTHLASYGAAVATVDVDTQTGRVTIKQLFGAIDAGLAVNPGNIENQISGQLIQTASRMLKEEVLFDTANVTSLDWSSYPILRFEEAPEVTPIVVQRLEERSTGAGEEVMAAAAAAIANAFFDATGVRLEEYPLTPARVLAALRQPVDRARG